MSDADLTWAVEASATQIALMWMVHQWELSLEESRKSLDLQIVNFSATAHGVMCAGHPILSDATAEELRWLTYFKALIVAETHPRDQMLTAIAAVRKQRADQAAKLSAKPAREPEHTGSSDPDSISHALAAIDRALSKASDSQRS
jgi:hypothetical protein